MGQWLLNFLSEYCSTLISVKPHKLENGDWVIDEKILLNTLSQKEATEAIIVRTLPNSNDKLTRDYSETNPPYFTESAIKALNSFGFTHLITDLPSIDKEQDGGLLNGHRAFWGLSESKLIHKTITEMVYIDNVVDDGIYLCNIQIAPIESDASPSKVILYEMFHKN